MQREKKRIKATVDTIEPSRVKLGKEISRGYFGVVHFGTMRGDVDEERVPIALKEIRMESFRGSSKEQLYAKEVEMMRVLEHPNVLPLLGCVTLESTRYMVTPFCAGGSLYSLISASSPRSVLLKSASFLRKMYIDVASGMSYLHKRNILHRDLRAANLLFNSDFSSCIICDFGLSRETGGRKQTVQMGNVKIMAPEVASGRDYGLPADVYSFSIVIYECGSRALFPVALANRMASSDFRPQVPPESPALLERCWAGDPRERPTFPEICASLLSSRYGGLEPPAVVAGPTESLSRSDTIVVVDEDGYIN